VRDFGFYNLDCMEGMKEFPDKYFDLAIVDPPFGIGDFQMKTHAGKYKPKTKVDVMPVNWNDGIPNKNYFNELVRVSKNQIVWGANYYNCFSKSGGAIVWYKNVGHSSLSDCEIASASFQKKVDYVYIQKLTGFVSTEDRIHPCQKPIKLYRWLLQNYAKQGDKILDTHVGSASSLIAFEKEGFDYVGFELDEDYFRDATKRLKQARITTIDMFKEPKKIVRENEEMCFDG